MSIREWKCNACGHIFETIQYSIDIKPEKCEKCSGECELQFPTGVTNVLKGSGWHRKDYPTKGAKILNKDNIKKLDKEQKLALAVQTIEAQTGRDLKEIVDSCKDDKEAKAAIQGNKVSVGVDNA